MRKLLLSIISLGFFLSASAQTISIINQDNGDAISNGQEYTVTGLASDLTVHVDYEVINLTASPIQFKYMRRRLAHTTGFTDQICDNLLCLDADDTYDYYRPAPYEIAANDSSDLLVKISPNHTSGCAIYRYYIMDDQNNIYDSVDVKYEIGGVSCFLTTPTITEIEYKAYPNPASDVFNIEMTTNGNNASLLLYNVLGEKVMTRILVDGKNTFSLEGMNNGVYFYTITKNGEVVETKKLVIRN